MHFKLFMHSDEIRVLNYSLDFYILLYYNMDIHISQFDRMSR